MFFKHHLAFLFIAVFFALLPSNSFAWGDIGHRIVCGIAFLELSKTARSEVNRLIQLDDEFENFSDSCIWPDHPRKRSKEHYVYLAREANGIRNKACPLEKKCLISAIIKDIKKLKTIRRGDDRRRLKALKYLGHWVGDLHQPMHVSFRDDRIGLDIKVKGPCKKNLHTAWDICLIERGLGIDTSNIIRNLHATINGQSRERSADGKVEKMIILSWANEAFRITIMPSVQYCVQKEDGCWYLPNVKAYDKGDTKKVVHTDDMYILKHLPLVREQLIRAGIRLAHILNVVLSN